MATVTNSITYHWAKPTPEEIRRQIIRLSFELEDLYEPMTVAGELARIDISERFVAKNSPDGVPWEKWALSYAPDALAHNTGGMLVREGDTRDAMASRSTYVPTNEGLFIDTSGIPEWGIWNNFGAERHSAGTSEEDKAGNAAVRGFSGDEAFGNLSGENALPARPFMGLTDSAKFKMDAAFYQWFDGEVALATSSRGKPFFRHAKRAGGTGPGRTRFAPID
jgi:phage gpG-like protein